MNGREEAADLDQDAHPERDRGSEAGGRVRLTPRCHNSPRWRDAIVRDWVD
jgi:hypothetical protein